MLWFHPHARLIASKLSLARETVVDETTILHHPRSPRLCRGAARLFGSAAARDWRHAVHRPPHAQPAHFAHRRGGFHVPSPRPRPVPPLRSPRRIAITAAAVDRFPMFATAAGPVGGLQARATASPCRRSSRKSSRNTRAEAMQQKIQGSVWLQCVVGETGDVTRRRGHPVARRRISASIRRPLTPPGSGNSSPGARMGSRWPSGSPSS